MTCMQTLASNCCGSTIGAHQGSWCGSQQPFLPVGHIPLHSGHPVYTCTCILVADLLVNAQRNQRKLSYVVLQPSLAAHWRSGPRILATLYAHTCYCERLALLSCVCVCVMSLRGRFGPERHVMVPRLAHVGPATLQSAPVCAVQALAVQD